MIRVLKHFRGPQPLILRAVCYTKVKGVIETVAELIYPLTEVFLVALMLVSPL